MSTKKYIQLNGRFNEEMENYFKTSITGIKELSEIYIRITSHGGNTGSMVNMSGLVHDIVQNYNCKFISEIVIADSAALIFAINMHERHVDINSTATVHLPVPSKDQIVSIRELEEKQQAAIDFFIERTHLSQQQVVYLNNQKEILNFEHMMQFGIATKTVPLFN
jgi:hypothetical protein